MSRKVNHMSVIRIKDSTTYIGPSSSNDFHGSCPNLLPPSFKTAGQRGRRAFFRTSLEHPIRLPSSSNLSASSLPLFQACLSDSRDTSPRTLLLHFYPISYSSKSRTIRHSDPLTIRHGPRKGVIRQRSTQMQQSSRTRQQKSRWHSEIGFMLDSSMETKEYARQRATRKTVVRMRRASARRARHGWADY